MHGTDTRTDPWETMLALGYPNMKKHGTVSPLVSAVTLSFTVLTRGQTGVLVPLTNDRVIS